MEYYLIYLYSIVYVEIIVDLIVSERHSVG
jgi:hypothetical protein